VGNGGLAARCFSEAIRSASIPARARCGLALLTRDEGYEAVGPSDCVWGQCGEAPEMNVGAALAESGVILMRRVVGGDP
jgi:hypothetical protein